MSTLRVLLLWTVFWTGIWSGLLTIPCVAASDASSSGSGGSRPFFLQKQEVKEKHRWSISDWLETRDKMRLQDLWFALHAPSPYEFYLDGLYRIANAKTGTQNPGWHFTFAAYSYFFGAEVQYDTSNLEPYWLGLANLRLMGVYNQATNLTVQVGAKQETRSSTSHLNWVAGANMTVYISKPAGLVILYRHTFGRSALAADIDHFEAGGFIDFNFVRLHVDYVTEAVVGDTSRSYEGVQLGTRLYF